MAESVKRSGRKMYCDRLPENMETIVWRYMDDWKFIDLIEQRSLYLHRGDRLQDRFEGTYSRQQMSDTYRWWEELEEKGSLTKGYSLDLKEQYQENRRKFYLNCWCMYPHDLDLMWKAYTKVCKAVAIQSRVSRLAAVCDCEKSPNHLPILNISTIKYCGLKEGDFIDEFPTGFNPFIHKDYHFGLDKEIRIIHRYPNLQDSNLNPEGRYMPVDLSLLIDRVVLSPGSTPKDAEVIKDLLDEAGLKNIPVKSSRYET